MSKTIKVLIIGDANSSHILKWVNSLSDSGINVGLWSLSEPTENLYDLNRVTLQSAGIKHNRFDIKGKLKYLTAVGNLKQFIRDFNPDIVHAHYASSYGLLGAMTGFHPYIISVWGSDVYDFPVKGSIYKQIIKSNLKKADYILSTSHVMAKETLKYTKKDIVVTPFGIDLNKFYNQGESNTELSRPFIFGTIKAMEKKYGIDYLIEAFAKLKSRYPNDSIQLLIVGGGSELENLKNLAQERGIANDCIFTGPVAFSQVPEYHQKIDISVFLSIMDSESFGVSAVEASATGTPVIVSNVGGLPEVIENGVTGLVVTAKNSEEAFLAMEKLYLDKELRKRLGENGRKRVEELYDWNKNVAQMIGIYNNITK